MLIPLFPWPTLPGTGLNITLNLLSWGWGCIAGLGLTAYLFRRRLQGGRVAVLLLSGAVLMTLPIGWTAPEQFAGALPRLAGLWALSIFLLLLLQVPVSAGLRRQVYGVVIIGGLLQALLAFWQVLSPLSAGGWLHYSAEITGWRPTGGLQQANLLGSFLSTSVTCGVWLVLSDRKPLSTSRRAVAGIAIILLSAGLVLTRSRSMQAAELLTIMLMLLFCTPVKGRRVLVISLLFAGILVGMATLYFQPSGQPVEGRASAFPDNAALRLEHDRRASDTERVAMFKGTVALIRESPFAGNGLATFEVRFPLALARSGIINPFTITVLYPHNELLYVWCEGGVIALVGLLLWLILWLQPWRNLLCGVLFYRRRNNTSSGQRAAAYGLITLPLMLHVMTEFPLYLSALHGLLLAILVRLALPVSATRCRNGSLSEGGRRRVLSTTVRIMALIGLIFMITGVQSSFKLQEAESFSLLDATPLTQLTNSYAQWDRLLYDQAVAGLMQFNLIRDPIFLEQFQMQARRWLSLHNDANLNFTMLQIARMKQDHQEERYWRQRGCLSFAADSRFSCSRPWREGDFVELRDE